MNKQIFFGQYKRITSYFDGTELASSGLPEGQELEILEKVRNKVPAELFTKPYTNPVGGTRENVRANLREGMRLLKEAGYEIRNLKLVNAKSGEPFAVEILSEEPSVERIILFYKPSLEHLGITVNVRTVDTTQYENRLRNWDFDIIIASWPESLSPGNEQRDYWSSQAADTAGLAQLHRNQESGSRCANQRGDIRERSCRSRRRHPGPRPRPAVEPVCGAPIHHRPDTHGALGSFCASGSAAQIFRAGVSHGVVVGLRKSGENRTAPVIKPAGVTRRATMALAAGGVVAVVSRRSQAEDTPLRHGMSAFGDLKYPADFQHFEYVEPNAPKGGIFSHVGSTRAFNQNFLTFNSLNTFILKGDAAQGMELTFASLMARAGDEPDAMYGLAARGVQISPDGLTYRFFLRPALTFHDGSPITRP